MPCMYSIHSFHSSIILTFHQSFFRCRRISLSLVVSFQCLFFLSFIRSGPKFFCLFTSFIRSFVHSSIRSLIHWFIRSFIRSFFRLFVSLFIRLFVCVFVRSFVCLLVCSFVRFFVHLFVRSFVSSFICSFVYASDQRICIWYNPDPCYRVVPTLQPYTHKPSRML